MIGFGQGPRGPLVFALVGAVGVSVALSDATHRGAHTGETHTQALFQGSRAQVVPKEGMPMFAMGLEHASFVRALADLGVIRLQGAASVARPALPVDSSTTDDLPQVVAAERMPVLAVRSVPVGGGLNHLVLVRRHAHQVRRIAARRVFAHMVNVVAWRDRANQFLPCRPVRPDHGSALPACPNHAIPKAVLCAGKVPASGGLVRLQHSVQPLQKRPAITWLHNRNLHRKTTPDNKSASRKHHMTCTS